MSTLRFNTWLNSAGTEEYYKCRAWVNFNGTGTVAIRASGNVSSITDNGVGEYTVNFTTPMPDTNYSVVAMSRSNQEPTTATLGYCALVALTTLVNTTSVRIFTANVTANSTAANIVGVVDHSFVSVVIFR